MTLEEHLKTMVDNPLTRRFEKRFKNQPPDIQKRLDELELYGADLLRIKRKRIYPQRGDVFLVSTIEGLYFYGLVLNGDVRYIPDEGGIISVIFFKNHTREKNMDNFKLDYDNIMTEPMIVVRNYWTSGYFYNVGRVELQPGEPDCGFYRGFHHMLLNDCGEELDHVPRYFGSYGLKSLVGVARVIQRELIVDSSILDENC